jgi:hypothetical protein
LIRSEVSVASTGRQCKLPPLFSQPAERGTLLPGLPTGCLAVFPTAA